MPFFAFFYILNAFFIDYIAFKSEPNINALIPNLKTVGSYSSGLIGKQSFPGGRRQFGK